MAFPLDGIRVIDLTIWQQGPYSTAMLGDLGADVIKVEGPDTPDPGRNPLWEENAAGLNAYFHSYNRSKRGIAIDLKTERGREIMYRLVEQSDVFVSNFRAPALKRLGVDYETLKKINPRLVYGRASGFGPNGPESDAPAMDLLGQARSGP
jgi:crotonobetainyl-CoA:carnitine CoA-transferase CaiB-like acyl-CoA transferase